MDKRSGEIPEEAITIATTSTTSTECNCAENAPAFEERLASVFRKIYILIGTMCVLCCIALAACGCSVFLYTEILAMRKQLAARIEVPWTGGQDSYDYDPHYGYQVAGDYDNYEAEDNSTRSGDQSDDHDREKRKDVEDVPTVTPKSRGRGGKGKSNRRRHSKKNSRCCKNLNRKVGALQKTLKTLKRKVDNMTLQTRVPATPPPTTRQPVTHNHQSLLNRQKYNNHVMGAHYTSYVTNDFIQSVFGGMDDGNLNLARVCKDMPEWSGILCRNRTFITTERSFTLNVFKEADWMKDQHTKPIFDMQDGTFIARYTGLYLVYAHVLFYDSHIRQGVELVHDGVGKDETTVRCTEDADINPPPPGFAPETRYISCSISAVLYMETTDTIRVRTLYKGSSIDLSAERTYFGGIVFVTANN